MTTVATEKRRTVAAKEWAEKARRVGTLRNLHIAGVVVLGLVNLYLLVHMAFAWRAANSDNAAALADQTIAMETAKIARQPLEGLDEKLAQATKDSDKFYKQRLPFADSEVAGELGTLAKKQGVKLIRVQYAHSLVLPGMAGELTEARMDASLSGDYRPLVLFVNSLERDKMFFLITGVTLTGQQSGTVGLRVRLTTYLRSPVGTEDSEKSAEDGDGEAAGGAADDGAAGGSTDAAGSSTNAAGGSTDAAGAPVAGGRR
jgi:type IV pilus assembly protein PilO